VSWGLFWQPVGEFLDVNAKYSAVLPATEHPTPATLDRLAHEYGLKDELDAGWAARPLELIREGGRTILLVEDPCGEPLDQLLGKPMEIGNFLRLAISIGWLRGGASKKGEPDRSVTFLVRHLRSQSRAIHVFAAPRRKGVVHLRWRITVCAFCNG